MVFGGFTYIRVSRIALMTLACVCFVVGIGIVAAGLQLHGWWWFVLGLVCFVAAGKRRVVVAVPAVVIGGILLGIWRGSDMAVQRAHYGESIGQKVNVEGTVTDDPGYDTKHQQDMLLDDITINGHHLPGKVRVKSLSPAEPQRGDRVRAGGKLYDGFGNYQASLYFADLTVIAAAHNPIDNIRRTFAARVYSLLPDTQAGLGLGFLLGIKSSLPTELNSELKLLGLTHIVVASGYNLTVLVRLARRLFASTSHFMITATSGVMIAGFIGVTGFSPSMSRAALVAGLSVWAWYYGRRIHPALLITCSAAITAAINPLYVWNDIGWWLSFLAFAGVMLLAPLLQRRIFGQKPPKLVGQVVLETICAQVLTMPLLILVFGNLSVLALPANVLVVPLIPPAMLFTFIAGSIGAVVPYVAWPSIWLLGYICQVVHWLATISWASVPFTISPWVFVVCCAVTVAVGVVLWRKTGHDYLSRSVIE